MKRIIPALLTFVFLFGSVGCDETADFQKWKRLAEQGDANAQYNLGVLYDYRRNTSDYRDGKLHVKGLPENENQSAETAMKWYRLAAEQGYAPAQNNLGRMYYEGQGVPEDNKTALKWYRLAVEKGYAEAQYNLGKMYQKGNGVPKDYKTALKWYRLAAEQGESSAQFTLAWEYAKGEGVPLDYARAHMWANFSDENYIESEPGTDPGAIFRDDLAKKMTPSQLEEAEKLARECVRKKYKGC